MNQSKVPEEIAVPSEARTQRSFVAHDGVAFWLESAANKKQLAVMASPSHSVLKNLQGTTQKIGEHVLLHADLTSENAAMLRRILPWLTPRPLGLVTSAGFGDRLGIATPGHVQAMQHHGAGISPIFAQQSIREMNRTKRSPQEVLDDATWGAFEGGWRESIGADADHQKTTQDIARCAEAGFTMFTIDPGEHVDDAAHHASPSDLKARLSELPWQELETTQSDFEKYVGQKIALEHQALELEREAVLRAAAKYAWAVLHVARLYRYLESKNIPFELEVSVDETATPTSHVEHAVVVLELKRLGVRWNSLAPRFVGQFEKGVDYIGGLQELGADLAGHAELARALGPYKLSLHSGSDKFSVYPLIAKATKGLVHLKTAGTSYLEALRIIARYSPSLFREILTLGRERFSEDRASYHISAKLERVPNPDALKDADFPEVLEQNDTRQLLHVTFGSALDKYKKQILEVLNSHEAAHYETLEQHFAKHLKPFREARENL